MKLRGITLTNVRHFAGKQARLSGICDGVTVLSEANEFGKSTFFDALHAVFFEKHRSTGKVVKALQPHSGGAPEVAVDLEVSQGRYSVTKRWLSRAFARVTDANGKIFAQDDEAEAWIGTLLAGGRAGPSGLLWVRQGLMGLEPDAKDDRDRDIATRRDLMSSVAGEIEVMTGGRRMNVVLDKVAAALLPLVTPTGKPKAGGDWALALDDAAEQAAQETVLREKVRSLGDDLRRRSDLLREQSRLGDPATVAGRETALAQARAAHQATLAHAGLQTEAAREVALCDLTCAATLKDIARLERFSARLRATRQDCDRAAATALTDRDHAEILSAKERSLAEGIVRTAADTRSLRLRLAAAQKGQLAHAARQRVSDLTRSLQLAEDVQRQLEAASAQRRLISVTPQAVALAEKSQIALDRLAARAEAEAPVLQFTYSGAERALRHGEPVEVGPLRIVVPTEFDLPGIGKLHVDPGAERGADLAAALAAAADAHARHLLACNAADLLAARRDLHASQRLDDVLRSAADALASIAPDGLAALRDACSHAAAEAGLAPNAAAEDPDALDLLVSGAEATEADARAAASTAQALAKLAAEKRAKSEADLRSAERAVAEGTEEAGDPTVLAMALSAHRDQLAAQQLRADAARSEVARLQATAPDLETATARLSRAASVVDLARKRADDLRAELASLNTRIELLADQGIEESLNTVIEARATAAARALRYDAEVQALFRLRRALDDARAQARDAYFGPVLRELTPLLEILHPAAALQIDDKTLLPVTLTRAGVHEPLDILSGGTREQLAILTRLAFARLFARAGQQVPVILDDALVYSDDDRIEAMFTALHRVATDQQILVLTCRQRAFAALGGEHAQVQVTDL